LKIVTKKNQLKYENCAINDTSNQDHNKIIHSITTMTTKKCMPCLR
jgi:hypothetical protein